jgi:hypothetical protein
MSSTLIQELTRAINTLGNPLIFGGRMPPKARL